MDGLSSMSETPLVVTDLDGTLCEQTSGGDEYARAAPIRSVIDAINILYDSGCNITINTARGKRTCKGDVVEVERRYRQLTEKWLADNGVKYHRLLFGKPPGDIYVEDRGVKPDELIYAPYGKIFRSSP